MNNRFVLVYFVHYINYFVFLSIIKAWFMQKTNHLKISKGYTIFIYHSLYSKYDLFCTNLP